MKTVYFNVLSRLNTEFLQQKKQTKKKHLNFVLIAKKKLHGEKFDFQNFAY